MLLTDVPSELLVAVLMRLDVPSVCRVARTCTAFHAVERSNAPGIWMALAHSAKLDTSELVTSAGLTWKSVVALSWSTRKRRTAASVDAINEQFDFFALVQGCCGCPDAWRGCPAHSTKPFIVSMELGGDGHGGFAFQTLENWEGPPSHDICMVIAEWKVECGQGLPRAVVSPRTHFTYQRGRGGISFRSPHYESAQRGFAQNAVLIPISYS